MTPPLDLDSIERRARVVRDYCNESLLKRDLPVPPNMAHPAATAADVAALIAEVRRLREGAALIRDISDYLNVRHELEYMDLLTAWKPLEARIVVFAQGHGRDE